MATPHGESLALSPTEDLPRLITYKSTENILSHVSQLYARGMYCVMHFIRKQKCSNAISVQHHHYLKVLICLHGCVGFVVILAHGNWEINSDLYGYCLQKMHIYVIIVTGEP